MNKKANKNQRFSRLFFPKNKKAIELSVNFLVIIIISLVMLSLGIYLMRYFFVQAESIKTNIEETTESDIESLLVHGQTVSIPIIKKDIRPKNHDSFSLVILNALGNTADFQATVIFDRAYDKSGEPLVGVTANWIFYHEPPFELNNNEGRKIQLLAVVPKGTQAGTYAFDVVVSAESSTYGSKKIYVEVI